MTKSATLARVSRARAAMISAAPFFGVLSLSLETAEAACGTACTDGTAIWFDPSFVAELRDDELAGLIAHEVMHCSNGHHVRRGGRDPELWNVACDLAINPLLLRAGFKLPAKALNESRFHSQSAETIYATLHAERAAAQRRQSGNPAASSAPAGASSAGKGAGPSTSTGPSSASSSKGSASAGQQAGPAGASSAPSDPAAGAPQAGPSAGPAGAEPSAGAPAPQGGPAGPAGTGNGPAAPGAPAPAGTAASGQGNAAGTGPSSPSTGPGSAGAPAAAGPGTADGTAPAKGSAAARAAWAAQANRDLGGCGGILDAAPAHDDAAMAEAAAAWETRTRQAIAIAKASNAGLVPGYLSGLVEIMAQPKHDCRDALRRFVDESSTKESSFARGNRRFLAGGLYLPGMISDAVRELLVMIDSSGSVDDELLREFGGTARAAFDDGVADRLVVIYCDSKVHRVDVFERGDEITMEVQGRGGTNFAPAFAYAAEHFPDASAAIYFTDLDCSSYGPEPSFPVLWAAYGTPAEIERRGARVPFGDVLHFTI